MIDWISILIGLAGMVYYIKGRLDTLEKQLNKRIDDLLQIYNQQIELMQSQIIALNKRINGLIQKN